MATSSNMTMRPDLKGNTLSTRMTRNPDKWYRERCESIRTNRNLSEEGKRRQLYEAHAKWQGEIRSNANADVDARQSRLDNALRPLLAPPGGHSAESRALQAEVKKSVRTADAATRAMQDALQRGDSLRAWAIGSTVIDRCLSPLPGSKQNYLPVLEQWGKSSHSIHTGLTQLNDVMGEPQVSLEEEMMRRMAPRPSEVPVDYRPPADSRDKGDHDDSDLTPWAQHLEQAKRRITGQGMPTGGPVSTGDSGLPDLS